MIYLSDSQLKNKIHDLENGIQQWAEQRDLWTDSRFTSYLEKHNDEPDEFTACITVLCSDGGIWGMFSGFYDLDDELTEFENFLSAMGFYCEVHDNTTFHICSKDETLNEQYLKYFEWQWIQHLVKPNYTNLYEELFEYFRKDPSKMHQLHHRKFEILISEVFRNQGYRTELGSGVGDGGIDVKLYKKDEIDEIVTLVQVKKYNSNNPIQLEAVSALSGIVNQERANRGLFVTTSRYLPGVKEFAVRENSLLTLADSSDVQRWCDLAKNVIVRDKSYSISDEYLRILISKQENKEGLEGKIVYCTTYHGMMLNHFCLIIKDSDHVVLLMKIANKIREYSDPPYNSTGTEQPELNEHIIQHKNKEDVFRAQKMPYENNKIGFWGRHNLYFLWDGSPKQFDCND
ncbi:restriction endonuclease [Pedobacter sp. AW31-3R]|uniref:restriction endonuclease n=1 Tax=Pedobacter sp. AW31-3R TaxID=3445781 RepID=UPI003FA0D629